MRNLLLFALFVFTTADLIAQSPEAAAHEARLPVVVGDEVRIRGPLRRDPLTIATVTDFGPAYLRFTVEEYPGVVFVRSYENLEAIDVKGWSRREGARAAALWGLYLAGAAGAIAGPFAANALDLETGTAIGVVGVSAGAIGALIGAAAGAVLYPVRWRRYVLN